MTIFEGKRHPMTKMNISFSVGNGVFPTVCYRWLKKEMVTWKQGGTFSDFFFLSSIKIIPLWFIRIPLLIFKNLLWNDEGKWRVQMTVEN